MSFVLINSISDRYFDDLTCVLVMSSCSVLLLFSTCTAITVMFLLNSYIRVCNFFITILYIFNKR